MRKDVRVDERKRESTSGKHAKETDPNPIDTQHIVPQPDPVPDAAPASGDLAFGEN